MCPPRACAPPVLLGPRCHVVAVVRTSALSHVQGAAPSLNKLHVRTRTLPPFPSPHSGPSPRLPSCAVRTPRGRLRTPRCALPRQRQCLANRYPFTPVNTPPRAPFTTPRCASHSHHSSTALQCPPPRPPSVLNRCFPSSIPTVGPLYKLPVASPDPTLPPPPPDLPTRPAHQHGHGFLPLPHRPPSQPRHARSTAAERVSTTEGTFQMPPN
eukprot:1973379-Rhodomonas_salina.1